MEVSKRLQRFIDYADSLQGAEVYWRESWGCFYCSLLNKSFGLFTNERLTIKGEPEKNIHLREKYKDVEAGYYTNKKHWNSINLKTEELSDEMIENLILESYELVFQRLTKADKLVVEEMSQK